MAKLIVYYAHPGHKHSQVNKQMARAAARIGGITFVDWVRRTRPDARGTCTATRGNHGQSQARAAKAAGMVARIFAPVGNSVEKNAAMRAFGAELIEFGEDFDNARAEAIRVAKEEGLMIVPPFHRELPEPAACSH